jgi:hypothetical protein
LNDELTVFNMLIYSAFRKIAAKSIYYPFLFLTSLL